ncbi:MAG: hypothetical protein JEY94_11170 [Melioribacteraceae bacterium]|nr:hypothetical protein [Melioribacteraceae bacterium]
MISSIIEMDDFYSTVYGQKNAITTLQKIQESKKIPHAFLFDGQNGVGKHFVAIQFAKALNSNLKGKQLSTTFKRIEKLEIPNIKYIVPLPRGRGETSEDSATAKLSEDQLDCIKKEFENKSKNPYYQIYIEKANNIKISSIRDIKKFVVLNYDDTSYRFILISDAHLMNDEAQNALLKSLEEPPDGIIFILMTPFKERLLTTIQSRCWQIKFEPLSDNSVENILTNKFNIESDLAKKVSVFSDGSVTNALDLLENDFEYFMEKTIEILRYSLARHYSTAFQIINELSKSNPKKSVTILIQFINKWLVDVVKNRINYEKNYYFKDALDIVEKFNSKYANINIEEIYKLNDRLVQTIDRNVSLNIITMNIIFEIASIGLK